MRHEYLGRNEPKDEEATRASICSFNSRAATALLTTAAFAQDVPQMDSQWYTDAQTTLQEMLARQPNTGRAKNVILLIADGNGVGTNHAIRLFEGQETGKLGEEHVLSYETFPNLALVKTYNINAQTPDSAPTAGAP
jgi:alkaline phosphatase